MKTRDQILDFLSQNKKLFRDKYHIDKMDSLVHMPVVSRIIRVI